MSEVPLRLLGRQEISVLDVCVCVCVCVGVCVYVCVGMNGCAHTFATEMVCCSIAS